MWIDVWLLSKNVEKRKKLSTLSTCSYVDKSVLICGQAVYKWKNTVEKIKTMVLYWVWGFLTKKSSKKRKKFETDYL